MATTNIISLFNNEKYKDFFDKYIKRAKLKNVNYVSFDIDSLEYTINDINIQIHDKDNDVQLSFEDTKNTLVFHNFDLLSSKSLNVYELLNLLSLNKFTIINSAKADLAASNKYTVYQVLQEAKILQPATLLVSPDDLKEEANSETINKVLEAINKNPKDDDEYVVKLLESHEGIGIFTINHKNFLSVMQMLSKMDDTKYFVVQPKLESKDGDVRAHILTVGDEQEIVCALHRKPNSKDFRATVTLGAEVEEVELTPAQKELALKVAKLSGLTWCDVTLMDSGGKTYVLEYNANTMELMNYVKQTNSDLFTVLINDLINMIKNNI